MATRHRWRVDLATGRATEEMTGGGAGTFPRINDAHTGREHRFGHFVTTRSLAADTMSDGLAKHDYLRDATTVVEGPDALTKPGEPVFVARENATSEDDGYLLTLGWNRFTGPAELLIHDACHLRRIPLARVNLPSRVPYGFHGDWADRATLDRALTTLRGDTHCRRGEARGEHDDRAARRLQAIPALRRQMCSSTWHGRRRRTGH